MASSSFPYCFPNHAEELHRRGAEFQRLPPQQRFDVILDLIASGEQLFAASPHRQAGERLRAGQEEEWRRALREVFARHGV
jgi:hypothetical protein